MDFFHVSHRYVKNRIWIKMDKKQDKSTWVIGGATLIGTGVGFVFLKTSALYFVASILIGIGVGLVLAQLISKQK